MVRQEDLNNALVTIYYCPSRRSPIRVTHDTVRDGIWSLDYAAVTPGQDDPATPQFDVLLLSRNAMVGCSLGCNFEALSNAPSPPNVIYPFAGTLVRTPYISNKTIPPTGAKPEVS